jgi:hypothetical protein
MEALKWLRQAHDLEQRTGDAKTRASTFLNLCAVYSLLGKHVDALQSATQALTLLKSDTTAKQPAPEEDLSHGRGVMEQVHPASMIAIAYHNIAVEQEHLQRFTDAYESYSKALRVAEVQCGPTTPLTCKIRIALANAAGASNAVPHAAGAAKPQSHDGLEQSLSSLSCAAKPVKGETGTSFEADRTVSNHVQSWTVSNHVSTVSNHAKPAGRPCAADDAFDVAGGDGPWRMGGDGHVKGGGDGRATRPASSSVEAAAAGADARSIEPSDAASIIAPLLPARQDARMQQAAQGMPAQQTAAPHDVHPRAHLTPEPPTRLPAWHHVRPCPPRQANGESASECRSAAPSWSDGSGRRGHAAAAEARTAEAQDKRASAGKGGSPGGQARRGSPGEARRAGEGRGAEGTLDKAVKEEARIRCWGRAECAESANEDVRLDEHGADAEGDAGWRLRMAQEEARFGRTGGAVPVPVPDQPHGFRRTGGAARQPPEPSLATAGPPLAAGPGAAARVQRERSSGSASEVSMESRDDPRSSRDCRARRPLSAARLPAEEDGGGSSGSQRGRQSRKTARPRTAGRERMEEGEREELLVLTDPSSDAGDKRTLHCTLYTLHTVSVH